MLSHLGACSSYSEVLLFEQSASFSPSNHIKPKSAFCQFTFDNADFNSRTIDGFHTIHIMGGIEAVTPKTAVESCPLIERIKRPTKTDGRSEGSANTIMS